MGPLFKRKPLPLTDRKEFPEPTGAERRRHAALPPKHELDNAVGVAIQLRSKLPDKSQAISQSTLFNSTSLPLQVNGASLETSVGEQQTSSEPPSKHKVESEAESQLLPESQGISQSQAWGCLFKGKSLPLPGYASVPEPSEAEMRDLAAPPSKRNEDAIRLESYLVRSFRDPPLLGTDDSEALSESSPRANPRTRRLQRRKERNEATRESR